MISNHFSPLYSEIHKKWRAMYRVAPSIRFMIPGKYKIDYQNSDENTRVLLGFGKASIEL